MKYQAYFEFIKYAFGYQTDVPVSSHGIDWSEFLAFCERQSLQGLVFHGIEQANITFPQDTLFDWIGCVEQIKALNWLTDKRSIKMRHFWGKRGYRSCILKGQANARMYPCPELRTPGDVDIWVEGNDVEITKVVLDEEPDARYSFHHVKMPVFDDVSVEVHYRPAYMSNWWKDRKLQNLTNSIAKRQFDNSIIAGNDGFVGLTDDFNALFMMIHMFGHCFTSRNNLKQLIDYYYLLKRGLKDEEKAWVASQFKALGVEKYARGIMWMEQEVLGLDEQYLIMQPDEKIGRLLLRYVLKYGYKSKQSKAGLLVHRITDNLPLMCHFPSAVLFNPLYLAWHQWWKWNMKRKLIS